MIPAIALAVYSVGWIATFIRSSQVWSRTPWERRDEDPLWTATKWPVGIVALLCIAFVVAYLWLDETLEHEGV